MIEIYGIKIDNEKADNIADSLGMKSEQFVLIANEMIRFFMREVRYGEVESKTEAFGLFLQSENFKKLNFTPSEPNHYILLGLMFAYGVERMKEEGIDTDLPTPERLLEILEKLKKMRG